MLESTKLKISISQKLRIATKGHPRGMLGKTAWNKGKKSSEKTRERIRQARLKQICPTLGKHWKLSDETRRKISEGKTKEQIQKFIEMIKKQSGKNHYKWITDRSKVVGLQNRNNPEYKQWRMQVWLRDNFKCKIANPNCSGRIEAHHILPWRDYPELHYQLNNGITLCHAHHPRKKDDEAKLSPYFQSLVAEMK